MLLHGESVSSTTTVGQPVRRHARALFSVPIKMHHLMAGGVRTSRGISLDLSEGGMGALVDGSLHIGDTIAVTLRLSECELKTVAIVRHTSDVRSGFEFLGLTAEERLRIANVVGNC
jgi:c-di-GMP-binding flagellar brake protein YcgR